MPTATATVQTPRPERYIKQLVSHMGRHNGGEVRDDGVGVFTGKTGALVTLTPAESAIHLKVEHADAETCAASAEAVGRHLIRFATQEELTVEWTSAGD